MTRTMAAARAACSSLAFGAAIAAAQMGIAAEGGAPGMPAIYLYETSPNYCPAGLSPVTIDGTISCGTPNTAARYDAVKRHPGARQAAPLRQRPPHTVSAGSSEAVWTRSVAAPVMGRPSIERDAARGHTPLAPDLGE